MDEAGNHVEAGGLAGAVGAEQPDHFAALDVQADRTHHRPLVETLADAGDDQALAAFDHARPRRFRRRFPRFGVFGSFWSSIEAHTKIMPVRV